MFESHRHLGMGGVGIKNVVYPKKEEVLVLF